MSRITRQLGIKLNNSGLFSPPFHLRHWKWFRLAILGAIDIVIIAACYWGAYVLRLDSFTIPYSDIYAKTLPLLVGIHIVVFFSAGLYRQVWQHANIHSAILIAKCCVVATVVFIGSTFLIGLERLPPRSVPLIFLLLEIVFSTFVKFSWRLWSGFLRSMAPIAEERCFIYGAGSAGALLARFVTSNPKFPYNVVGFIDDDRNKGSRLLHGIKIYGTGADLPQLVAAHQVTTVILAMHAAPGKVIRDIVKRCQSAGVKPLIMPDISNAFGSDVIQPRAVDVKDLLRRSPKSIDAVQVSRFFEGTTVLVTGAGGSIGSEICRQLVGFKPRKIVLFDASEYNLYQIHTELVDQGLEGIECVAVLGTLLDERLVHSTFSEHQPSIVLHAAAYKHVYLVEENPVQAILNNILSTKILGETAVNFKVRSFLLVSTDKAVRPTSIMGATKRCCEVVVASLHQRYADRCKFAAVRFGNVLGSSGSVVPRFLKQIQSGGPVTVTHPDVNRYFMLTSEAVGLVLQSISMAKGGETFVLDMGTPVNIYEMAKQLIHLAGKVPGFDIDIIITGLKPGEKLYEELILEGSEQKTLHDDVMVAVSQNFDGVRAEQAIHSLLSHAHAGNETEALRTLWEIAGIQERLPEIDMENEEPVDRLRSEPLTIH